jgi:hypothetical protein
MRIHSKQIGKLSVSDAIRLHRCERQVGFARDSQFDTLTSTTVYSHLGNVIHKVTEDFASFPADRDFKEWFDIKTLLYNQRRLCISVCEVNLAVLTLLESKDTTEYFLKYDQLTRIQFKKRTLS